MGCSEDCIVSTWLPYSTTGCAPHKSRGAVLTDHGGAVLWYLSLGSVSQHPSFTWSTGCTSGHFLQLGLRQKRDSTLGVSGARGHRSAGAEDIGMVVSVEVASVLEDKTASTWVNHKRLGAPG